jgi:hypothetical protein
MKKLMIGLAALLAASSAYAAGDAGTTVSVNGWVTVGVANASHPSITKTKNLT